LEEIIFENFNVSENNIISVKSAKVLTRVSRLLAFCAPVGRRHGLEYFPVVEIESLCRKNCHSESLKSQSFLTQKLEHCNLGQWAFKSR
jgi:hypothetical protein